jgi:hypothetical protein
MMNPKMNNVLCGVVLLVLSAALVVPPVLILMNKDMKLGGHPLGETKFSLLPDPFGSKKSGEHSLLDFADGKLSACPQGAELVGSSCPGKNAAPDVMHTCCLEFTGKNAGKKLTDVVKLAYLETMLSLSIGCLLFVFAVVCFVKAAGK